MSLAARKIDHRPSAPEAGVAARPALPISKLRGVPAGLRTALKARRIVTCDQLLAVGATADLRRQLADAVGVDEESVLILVQRADMARVNGVGAVFCLMLEDLGVYCVGDLAAADPVPLHGRLRDLNQTQRIARRSPTPEEVADWVAQARALPRLIS